MSALVFLLPVRDRWLLSAPFHGFGAVGDSAMERGLRHGAEANRRRHERASEVTRLREMLTARHGAEPGPRRGDFEPSLLGIIPSRGCNIRCLYCDFGAGSSDREVMDSRVALTAVDWMADLLERQGRPQFHLHFFGGEPFHTPDLVELTARRARSVCRRRGLQAYIEVSTNGVFGERQARRIGDRFDGVVLSLDGPAEFQNRNRPGLKGQPTSSIVERTARLLSSMPLDLCIRACITQDSVDRMEEIAAWMCESFRPKVINFETLKECGPSRQFGLTPPDPYLFARHFVQARRLAARSGVHAVYAASEPTPPRISFCPVGADALIVAPDGAIASCYLRPQSWRQAGLEMEFGRVGTDGSVHIDVEALESSRRLPLDKPGCAGCFCRWSCAGGCHVARDRSGGATSTSDFCVQTRLITACLTLEGMGHADLADRLLEDRPSMRALALQRDDALDLEEKEVGPSPAPRRAAPRSTRPGADPTEIGPAMAGFSHVHSTLPIFRLEDSNRGIFYVPGQVLITDRREADAVESALEGKLPAPLPVATQARRLENAATVALAEWNRMVEGDFAPDCLTVYLSNHCNLQCSYCFAARQNRRHPEAGGTKVLELDAIVAAANLVAQSCAERNRTFQLVVQGGGEPTLHWELLRKVVFRTRQVAAVHGLEWRGYLATNGLLSEERARWVARRFSRVGLSCDGPPEIQDALRPATNGLATSRMVERTARIFAEEGIGWSVRGTVCPEFVDRQSEMVAYFSERLGAREARLEPVYRSEPGRPGFLPEDAPRFVTAFVKAEGLAAKLGLTLGLAGVRPSELHGSHCDVLRNALRLIPDGSITTCLLCTDSLRSDDQRTVIGRWEGSTGKLRLDRSRAAELRRRAAIVPSPCRDCINVLHCSRGCPDICPLNGSESVSGGDLPGSFRCRVHRGLAESWIRRVAGTGRH